MSGLWDYCFQRLSEELPTQQFNTWIRPLQAVEQGAELVLLAPNRFVLDWVKQNFSGRIETLVANQDLYPQRHLVLEIGTRAQTEQKTVQPAFRKAVQPKKNHGSNLNISFTFDNFVEGKSNQLAKAASKQVAESAGRAYNPLFLYGGVGLGKTHLMHAIGNHVLVGNPAASIIYLHSERFVSDMVTALQHNAIGAFKEFYRNVDVLLIDDIQFFAGKERSQEEFFYTFNTLLENHRQVVLTCDRYPKEIKGLEERLKSRFGWGLPVAIEPPDLETRAAILMTKAGEARVALPAEVAFFVAKRIRSNVRELEGALRRVVASAEFTGRDISIELAKEALRDLLACQDRQISIENIQKTVADYYRVKVSELLSNKRTQSITRPRQVAMALAKEITSHSLPEIGAAFGGRDHTTVLHACRKIRGLIDDGDKLAEDYSILLRTLSD